MVYSPTKGEYGIKKTVTEEGKNGALIAWHLATASAFPGITGLEDATQMYGKKHFEKKKKEKYTLITPRFSGALRERLKSIIGKGSLSEVHHFLKAYQEYIKTWTHLVRTTGLLHPDLHPRNIFHIDGGKLAFADFDELTPGHCISKRFLGDHLDSFYMTEKPLKASLTHNVRSLFNYLTAQLYSLSQESTKIEGGRLIMSFLLDMLSCLQPEGDLKINKLSFSSSIQLYGPQLRAYFGEENSLPTDNIFKMPLGEFLNRMDALADKELETTLSEEILFNAFGEIPSGESVWS